jgi:site-specific DNA recombinase
MIDLARVHHPPFQVILVWKLNRFARNRFDSITYKTLLKSRGIKVISINEPLDDSPSGKLLEGVIESIDEFYSANLGQDIKRGMRENAQRGFFNGSRPPYGFHKAAVKDGDRTRYKLEPDPDDTVAFQAVRKIFDMALKDRGCKEIAKALNEEGIRTGTGRPWGSTTVHKVLTNEAYCGTLVWAGRPGHTAIHNSDPPVRVENAWLPIIDRDIFRNIQRKMASRRPEVTPPRTLSSSYLLSGLLYCSCGHSMIGRGAKSHLYHYYVCNKSYKKGRKSCGARALPKERLEHMVVEQIQEKVLNQECLEELVRLVNEEIDSTYGAATDRLDAIDAELRNVRNRLSMLYDALETGRLGLDDLAPRIKELKIRQDELTKARLQLQAEMAASEAKHVNEQIVKSYAEDLKSLFKEAGITESKAFLRSFINRIDIRDNHAVINYRLPLPPYRYEKQSVEVLPAATFGGDRGIRTPDLCDANAALSQLSYIPLFIS